MNEDGNVAYNQFHDSIFIVLNLICFCEVLLSMGYSKLVNKKDEHEAAASGLMSKPLTQPGVEKALKDFGLDADSASHQSLASLSQGQLNV